MSGRLHLVRHGETEWARDGRHTGLTDIALTARGEKQAAALRPVLGHRRWSAVLVSPLARARRTAALAGLSGAQTDEDLHEWDYGGYEGLTTPQIREQTGTQWTVFDDGVVPGESPGETLDDVAARGRAVLDRVRPALADGDVVLVGHGHALRVLATCWLGVPPTFGASLLLDPATTSVLGEHHGTPAVVAWNVPVG
jgi:probable phosphoglycerate mutase